MKTLLVLLQMTICVPHALAQSGLVLVMPIIQGKIYQVARALLFAHGWEPFQAEDSDCKNNSSKSICRKFPETRYCVEDACQMTSRKRGHVITVVTFGEHHSIQGVRDDLVP